ncbi:MAG: ABC transporter substrate-binding protein [Limnothrix sp.]
MKLNLGFYNQCLGISFSLIFLLFGCNQTLDKESVDVSVGQNCVQDFNQDTDYFPEKVAPDFATGFTVDYRKNYKVVTVKQPWEDTNQNLEYVFVQCGTPIPTEYPDATIVEIPVNRVIAMSTTYLPHIEILNQQETLVGVGDRRLIYSSKIRESIVSGAVQEVGDLQQDNEIVLGLQPDVIFSYRLENSESGGLETLESLGLKIVLDAAHLEASPLGRAEWLKFTALLFNEEATANQEFVAIAQRYQKLKDLAQDIAEKPTVISGSPYQGTWYSPGGKSFFAQLFRDANVTYPWDETKSRLSLPLDFEVVLNKAKNANYWINVNPAWQTTNDAFSEDQRYELLGAAIAGNIYAANARIAEDGGNDFWEGGVTNPDVVLADLIKIFHPDLLPEHELFYYQQLQ